MIGPSRTPDIARTALSDLPWAEHSVLDLLDPGSIDTFTSEFLACGRPLHILINNAGLWSRI